MVSFSCSIRAISPILATLLLIVIVVAASIAAYAWIQSSTESQINTASGFIIIENVLFYDTNQLDLTIRNTGTSDLKIDTIYIDDVKHSVAQNIQTKKSATVTLEYSWTSGTKYKIKVASNTGLYAEGLYSTPGAPSSSDIIDYASMHYVNTTSNVDGSSDKGTHTNFADQRVGPDSIFDTLTEDNTGGSANSTLLDDGFEGSAWDVNWNDASSDWREDDSPVHSGSSSAFASNNNEGTFTSDILDASDASAIYLDFWFMKDDTEGTDFTLYYYDGSSYDLIDELDDNGGDDTWLHFTAKITDSQYFVPNFRVRFDATLGSSENVWVDDVIITKEVNADNFELDIEIQFTDIDVSKNYEEISIFMGSATGEALDVYVWNGGSWDSLVAGLTPNQWNNVTRTITEDIVTLRFLGNLETSDTNQDTWEIDCSLLYAPP
jgi:flagellin-like protein